jgi:hypothetical protein
MNVMLNPRSRGVLNFNTIKVSGLLSHFVAFASAVETNYGKPLGLDEIASCVPPKGVHVLDQTVIAIVSGVSTTQALAVPLALSCGEIPPLALMFYTSEPLWPSALLYNPRSR